ncbi:MAG: hypothetical protein ACYDHN_15840 [Solirubrobacteraceae bacterium]
MSTTEQAQSAFPDVQGGADTAPDERFAPTPVPASERRAWLVAGATALFGVLLLAAILSGLVGRTATTATAPPPVIVSVASPTQTPAPTGSGAASAKPAAKILAHPSGIQQSADATRFAQATQTHIATRWMEGFYPIYSAAQGTFGVNWLLIASIHMQETAFSTAPTTYHGLNFAHCCGGPMQFNVTNGPLTTWSLVSDSYIYAKRPVAYDHMTKVHPSIYDDFDAIMAAAHLLSADGAGYTLDDSAWNAAYDYYGHDATGVTYADQVLARAIGWSQHGFCINCATDATLVADVHAAYGAPVAAALAEQAAAPKPQASAARKKSKG